MCCGGADAADGRQGLFLLLPQTHTGFGMTGNSMIRNTRELQSQHGTGSRQLELIGEGRSSLCYAAHWIPLGGNGSNRGECRYGGIASNVLLPYERDAGHSCS
jgi:hypothetical protein